MTAQVAEAPPAGKRFLDSVMEYVFMTEWCGLSPADAGQAMGRSDRVAERYRAYLRAHPEIRELALAPYTGGDVDQVA